MKAYDKYEVDETFKCWSSDLAELNVIEVIPLKVLDKIRAEIEKFPSGYTGLDKQEVLNIIDKYKESEDKE